MNEKEKKRGDFIQLYRRKLQNDLEDMGYPGGKENKASSIRVHRNEALIIDAGSELSGLTGDSTSKTRREAAQQ